MVQAQADSSGCSQLLMGEFSALVGQHHCYSNRKLQNLHTKPEESLGAPRGNLSLLRFARHRQNLLWGWDWRMDSTVMWVE